MEYIIGLILVIIILIFFFSARECMSTAQKLPLIKGFIGYNLATRAEAYEDKKENPALIKILYFG